MNSATLMNLAWRIAKEMPQGYTDDVDILDSAYGTCKRMFGANTARLLFFYEDGFENLMIEQYVAVA